MRFCWNSEIAEIIPVEPDAINIAEGNAWFFLFFIGKWEGRVVIYWVII